MVLTMTQALRKNFLGQAPDWYKLTIIGFLILNPILLYTVGPFITGWILILEFIFTLAMALKCYPLQSGGLLAIEAVIIGLTTPMAVYIEARTNFQVILLLMFMVAGIYFMKDLLMVIFTKVLLGVQNKTLLSLLFCAIAAILSAFLDALTVMAVIISVGVGFYTIYHQVASQQGAKQSQGKSHSLVVDDHFPELHQADLNQFRNFLRSLLMHGAIGTALGGVMTLVGEPQNLLIAEKAEWQFLEFFFRMAPVTIPVFIFGLLTCITVEKFKIFGYGTTMPNPVRSILEKVQKEKVMNQTKREKAALMVQAVVGIWLIIALGLHLAEVGVIGLSIIVLTTAFNGVIEEHAIGRAFEEALPFTALLVVFFAVVAVIHEQHLFNPVLHAVLGLEGDLRMAMFYLVNGVLSMISDNVFVATVYINSVEAALLNQEITRAEFDLIAVAINTGTNIPSVATPNGQAAFLFLLTSAIAPLVRLSYGRMVWMALPYFMVMTIVGFLCVAFVVEVITPMMYDSGIITMHPDLVRELGQ